MAAYLQMGHNTENLVGTQGLEGFRGVVLSPVNRDRAELTANIQRFRAAGDFEIVFDPQLYFPRATRGKLPAHPYFPSDLDSADLSSATWWNARIGEIVDYATGLGVDAICTPLILPGNNRWSDDYFAHAVENYNTLRARLSGSPQRALMTVIVSWDQLDNVADAMQIASVLTQYQAPDCIYLVIEAMVPPRQELADDTRLLALMALVSALEQAGSRVLVSHCSSEMILLKAAGASDCSTGSFFNLRRFTRSRFENDEEGGGRQIPYWFEQGVIAFLREADVRRILNEEDLREIIGTGSSGNTFATEILNIFEEARSHSTRPVWQALSWRQYLAWFAAAEADLTGPDRILVAQAWLRQADEKWEQIEDNNVFLEERRNDGRWIRAWLQALSSFTRL